MSSLVFYCYDSAPRLKAALLTASAMVSFRIFGYLTSPTWKAWRLLRV